MIHLALSLLCMLLCFDLVLTALSVRKYDELTVYTSNGPITGHHASNATSVIEYLGIPFARPPTGELRFAAPEKLSELVPYEASDWGFDCPHAVPKPFNYPGFTPQARNVTADFSIGPYTTQSEDCLTLNVWTKPAQSDDLRPVLVFLYGGRFASGFTHTPMTNGQYFANATNTILVTVNYRTNIFGFPGTPDLPNQNPGLRDQRMALEWLRDNIVAFGGDSSRITLMGQSAGGVAADWFTYAYKYDPIVSGVVAHSGNAFSFPLNEVNVTHANWYNVSSALGCGSTGDTTACMRTKNWTDIKDAAGRVKSGVSSSRLRTLPPFQPVVDNVTVFDDYLERMQNGDFAKLPYLIGNNNYDQGYYKFSAYTAGNNVTETEGDDFLLASFTCPNALEAGSRAAAGLPVWRWRYFGDWENTRLYDNSSFNPGGSQAYHGSELQMIFGASEDVTDLPTSEAQRSVTQWMQKAWAAFAADSVNGLEEQIGWPRYAEGQDTLAVLAKGNSHQVKYVRPEVYDAPCAGVQLAGLPG